MARKAASSVEEKVEYEAKRQLDAIGVKHYGKTDNINPSIEAALKSAPSKVGGSGTNYPDVKCLIKLPNGNMLPVMIEAKGRKGDIARFDADGYPDMKPAPVKRYALNGALHYAHAVIDAECGYDKCLAIGINGWDDPDGEFRFEVAPYYCSTENDSIDKPLFGADEITDLSFLGNTDRIAEAIGNISLTDEERVAIADRVENELDARLRELNQKMQDEVPVMVNHRVNFVCGMIMAGIGCPGVTPISSDDLRGETGRTSNDGSTIVNKISDFLDAKGIQQDTRQLLIEQFNTVFLHSGMWMPNKDTGESKIKTLYKWFEQGILPIFKTNSKIDFTGRMFSTLNSWVSVPDGDRNDVVLTPRYITRFMAQLADVDMDSYCWDYTLGSAGFLVAAFEEMRKDAERRITSDSELKAKIDHIKNLQLLGIEKLPEIYMLAVLNMLLMGENADNIIQGDSLVYDGNYPKGSPNAGSKFPANRFLLNPPYSQPGKGMIFVKKALCDSGMDNGYASVLIQENAGSGNGDTYTADILKKNTLMASIHMADIFCGKASVQTAIFVFKIGRHHRKDDIVKFYDFSNDGYSRQNRKKSSQDVNLKNTDHAPERYEEIVKSVVNGKKPDKWLPANCYIEDTITLDGNDWTFAQHKKIDLTPTEDDFKKTVADYLAYKVSDLMSRRN